MLQKSLTKPVRAAINRRAFELARLAFPAVKREIEAQASEMILSPGASDYKVITAIDTMILSAQTCVRIECRDA